MPYDVCSGTVLISLLVTWSVSKGNCGVIEDQDPPLAGIMVHLGLSVTG